MFRAGIAFTHNEGPRADVDAEGAEMVVLEREILPRADGEQIIARRQVARRGQFGDAGAEIVVVRQLRVPGTGRRFGEDGGQLLARRQRIVIQRGGGGLPREGIEAQPNLVEILVLEENVGTGGRPRGHGFGFDFGGFQFFHDDLAEFAECVLREGGRADLGEVVGLPVLACQLQPGGHVQPRVRADGVFGIGVDERPPRGVAAGFSGFTNDPGGPAEAGEIAVEKRRAVGIGAVEVQ